MVAVVTMGVQVIATPLLSPAAFPPHGGGHRTTRPMDLPQKGIVVLAALQLLWALAGFIAEPAQ